MRSPVRRAAAVTLCCAAALVGCGGGEPSAVPDAAPAPRVNAAPANPAPAANRAPRRRPTRPKRPEALVALPEGAARYVLVPPAGAAGGDGAVPDLPNFVLTGETRGPADARGVALAERQPGDPRRFGIAELPAPPGGETPGAPPGFEVLREAGTGPAGLPRRMRAAKDGMILSLIPAGVVRLGEPDAPGEGDAGERPSVYVSPFYMDRHEVTVGQFARFLSESGSRADPPANADAPPEHPALGLPWRSAFLYARWVGRDLPTEAEWVRAFRGDGDFRFPWGNAQPVFGRTRRSGEIAPVMSVRTDRSPFGVYDLAGNAGEWTTQTFAEDPLRGERTDAAGLYRNPDRGSGAGGAKAVRGLGDGWAASRRVGLDQKGDLSGVGFRCVWRPTVDGTPGGDPLPGVGTASAGAGTRR